MKNETKDLLTIKGTLSAVTRVSEYINSLIEKGDTPLEEKIIASGKSINDCWKYIEYKAKELAKNDNSCCVDDEDVFGWAVHYYEDNELAEKEMHPAPTKPTTSTTSTPSTTKTTKAKSKATSKAKSTKTTSKKQDFIPMTDEEWESEENAETPTEDLDFLLGDDDKPSGKSLDLGFDTSDVPF